MWNATREIFNALPDSGFVKRPRARSRTTRTTSSSSSSRSGPAKDGTFDVGDLHAAHEEGHRRDVPQARTRCCGSIQNRHLGALVQAYLDDER